MASTTTICSSAPPASGPVGRVSNWPHRMRVSHVPLMLWSYKLLFTLRFTFSLAEEKPRGSTAARRASYTISQEHDITALALAPGFLIRYKLCASSRAAGWLAHICDFPCGVHVASSSRRADLAIFSKGYWLHGVIASTVLTAPALTKAIQSRPRWG